VVPAIDGILNAFQTHPSAGIEDDRNSAREEEFYAAPVRAAKTCTGPLHDCGKSQGIVLNFTAVA